MSPGQRGGDSGATATEQTPLIASHDDSNEPLREPSPSPPRARPGLRQVGIVSACIFLIILTELGAYLATIPLNQVLEEIICRNFHPDLLFDPNDPRCKDRAVQTELSLLRGWQMTFDFVPGLLTAIPYGFVADKYGRELVLTLSMTGITLSSGFYVLVCALPTIFPHRLTWLSAIFTFIGGGPAVLNAMLFTITGDVVTEQQRSTTFFYLAAAVIGGEMISSPLVYFLMEVDLWLAIWLGLSCLIAATIMTVFMPETRPKTPPASQDVAGDTEASVDEADRKSLWWLRKGRAELRRLGEAALEFARGNWQVMALLFTLLVTTLGRFAQEILLQYVTKRYGWSWSQASLLLFIRAFFTLALYVAVLPIAGYILISKCSLSGQAKDFWLARGSVVLLMFGAFIIGLAATPVLMGIGVGVLALGSGYTILIRSLLASVVEKHQIGMLYTVIGVLETVGILIAGPLLAFSYRVGLAWEGAWIGLPYIVAGSLFALAALTLSIVVNMSRLVHN